MRRRELRPRTAPRVLQHIVRYSRDRAVCSSAINSVRHLEPCLLTEQELRAAKDNLKTAVSVV